MTSTNPSDKIGGYRSEVDHQKLGPSLRNCLESDTCDSDRSMDPDA